MADNNMNPTLISLTSDQKIELNKSSMFVGASEWRVDIHLTQSDIDDVHCELNSDSAPLKIVDLSGKGVLVNGEVVNEKTLSDGDELQIGAARFVVQTISDDAVESSGDVVESPAQSDSSSAFEHPTSAKVESQAVAQVGVLDEQINQPLDVQNLDEDAWLVELGSTVLGPMSRDDVEQLINTSQLTISDPIRNVNQADWITINEWQNVGHAAEQSTSEQSATDDFNDQDYATQSQDTAKEHDDEFDEPPDVSFDTVTPRGMQEKPIFAATPQPLISKTTSDLVPQETPSTSVEASQEHFFVVLAHREEGPVPLFAIQDLADQDLVKPLSPMRRESERTWTTAQLYGVTFSDPNDESFDVPADHVTNKRRAKKNSPTSGTTPNKDDSLIGSTGSNQASTTKPSSKELEQNPKNKDRRGLAGTLMWCAVAPWYYVTTGITSVRSMKPQQIAGAVIVLAVCWYFAAGWMRGWTQTALTGVMTMDEKPLADVVITVSGLTTGESALGVTDSDGDFRLITLHGRLKPGTYHVVVQRQNEAGSESPPDDDEIEIPIKYQDITTTDATFEVAEETEHVEINLTAKRRHRYIH